MRFEKRSVMIKFKILMFNEIFKCYWIQWGIDYLMESIIVDRMCVTSYKIDYASERFTNIRI